MSDEEAITIKSAIKLLKVTLRNDCNNELADSITGCAIELLEGIVA